MEGAGKSLFPALDSPQRQGNATGSSRNKVALPKGRSLMDWIRLGNSGADLTGVGGRLIKVSPEELKKHDKREDCWMAIGGAVYNITQYCEFHPGGIAEIMKGAGKDGTRLFNEVHRWVNYDSMLRKCLVGKLVSETIFNRPAQYGNLLAPPRAMGTSLSTVNKPQVAPQSSGNSPSVPFSRPATPSKPRYDYYQNESTVKLSIYTRMSGVSSDNLVLERPEGNIKLSLYLPSNKVYKIHIAPSHPLQLSCKMKSVKTIGKIELDFPKLEKGLKWTKLGEYLSDHDSLSDRHHIDTRAASTSSSTSVGSDEYILATLSEVKSLTHDTNLYTVSLPPGYEMPVPIGHHVKLKASILGMELERSYTPVCLLNKMEEAEIGSDNSTLYFLIKIYSDGAFTQHLNALKIGDTIPISHHMGQFSLSQIEFYTSVLLLAAGTGFTPMTKLITHCIANKKQIHLVYFNKTESDISWRQELEEMTANKCFKVTHVLSQADSSWAGHTGRLTKRLMDTFLPVSTKSSTFIATCGPIPFTKLCQEFLLAADCEEQQVHIFQE